MIAILEDVFFRAGAGDGQATFFTVDRATRALKEVLDSALLASIERCIFFQFGAIKFVAYGNNIGHGIPCGIRQRFKLEKYIILPKAMSIGNGGAESAGRATGLVGRSCQSHHAVIIYQIAQKIHGPRA